MWKMRTVMSGLLGLWVFAANATEPLPTRAVVDRRLMLPTDWPVGSVHRYRGSWKRDARTSLPDPEGFVEGMRSTLDAVVTITVVARSDAGYVLRWEPRVMPSADPARAATDATALGTALWRYQQSLPLDVELFEDGGNWSWDIRNLHSAQEAVAHELARSVTAIGIDCAGVDEQLCQGTANQAVFDLPLFECIGIEVKAGPPEAWVQPHATLGDAVPVKFRREIVDYAADATTVQVRTSWEPEAEKLRIWLESAITKAGMSSDQAAVIAAMSIRHEEDCTVDRSSGWPVTFMRRMTSTGASVVGSEVITFERVSPR